MGTKGTGTPKRQFSGSVMFQGIQEFLSVTGGGRMILYVER